MAGEGGGELGWGFDVGDVGGLLDEVKMAARNIGVQEGQIALVHNLQGVFKHPVGFCREARNDVGSEDHVLAARFKISTEHNIYNR